MKYITSTVISNTIISDNIRVLSLERMQLNPIAGQFFMFDCHNEALPLMRPISIFRVEDNALCFMYRIVGKGTNSLALLKTNDRIKIMGPLGNGFPITQVSGRIALAGGGLGIPPLCESARQLQQYHIVSDAYLGYRDEIFALEDFEDFSRQIFVSSENGPEGYRGVISDLLKPEEYDGVFTCGPEAMMRKIASLCHQAGTPCWCSVERRMACGVGACLGCSIRTVHGMKRVCSDGPVFLCSEIFDL